MGTKSREYIYGASIRHSAERAKEARKEPDRLACVVWNQRMLGYKRARPAVPGAGGRAQRRLLLPRRGPLPGLRHEPDRRLRRRAPPEEHADPRTRTVHALQGLLAGPRLPLQAEPSGGAASAEDFRQGSPDTDWRDKSLIHMSLEGSASALIYT
jgi:hypothetical protein